MAKQTELKLPSVLSLYKKVNVTDASFSDVKLYLKASRNAKANAGKNKNKDTADNVNLNTSEMAEALTDKTKVSFEMQVMSFKEFISQTNNYEFYTKFNEYFDAKNFTEELKKIASYMAYNVLSGRWLWRNLDIVDTLVISVYKEIGNDKVEIVKNFDVNIKPNLELDGDNEIKNKFSELEKLTKSFVDDFMSDSNEGHYVIEAILDTYPKQKLYPSQLFTETNKAKNAPSREFYRDINGNAAISAEKVWNAIRTYDVWYDLYDEIKEPISIEPLGSNLKFQDTLRSSKNNFYALLQKWHNDEKAEFTEEEKIYMLSSIIRGGAIAETKEK